MADKNKTVFQNLNDMMNLDGTGNNIREPQQNKKVIIRGNSPEEIKRKNLELQQQNAIDNKFFKTVDHGFQKAMQYEAARLPAYLDYEGMEYYPIIASALDLLMEEATTIGEDGKMLKIYSDKGRIKTHLDELFYDIINVNVNLPFWTRNLPIRSDSMIPLLDGTEMKIQDIANKLKENPEKEIWTYSINTETSNVVGGKIIWCDKTRENSELVRVTLDDGTYLDTTPDHEFMTRDGNFIEAKDLKKHQSLMPFYTRKSDGAKDSLNGYEKVYNPRSDYYKYTHNIVAHEIHRNLNEEKKYGGIFDTHHKDFNKLNNNPNNLERLSREEHFKMHQEIAIKNLHTPEITKKRMVGINRYLRSDERKKYLSKKMKGIYPDYFNEYNNSKLHNEHNKIRSNSMLDHWSNDEYKNSTSKKMQINLSDKCILIINNIMCSLDEYLPRNKFAELLKENSDFVNEFIKYNSHNKRNKLKSINGKTLNDMLIRKTNLTYHDYVVTINPSIENDKRYLKSIGISKGKLVNHKVVSVEYLTETSDVYCMEVVGSNGEHDRHNFAVCSKNIDGTYSRNGVFVSNCKYGDNFVYMLGEKKKGITVIKQMVNYEMERIERIHKGKADVRFKQKETNDEFNIFEIAHFRLLGDDKYLPYGSSTLNKIRRVFRQLIMAEDAMLTYRIVRAGEKRVFKIDVGNIDEDDIEAYTQRIAARFKKQQQVNRNNGQIDYRFNILGNDEDYILPVRNGNVQTGIDTLPGASNLDQISDIEYLRDNLFTGLGIPKPFLGFQESAGDGKNMAQMDIRFAKKINRIQQAIIQELNKMAIIHLYLLGFSQEDLSNFTLSLTNPSTQQDLLKTELMQAKGQVYSELTRSEGGIAAMSHTMAKKRILNMSEKEIIDDLKMQRMERAVSQELQDSPLVIRETGLFTDVDEKYGSGEVPPEGGMEGGAEGGMEGGGEDINIPPADGGGVDAPQSPNELPPVIGQGQGFGDKRPLIVSEDNYKKYGKKFDNFIDEMVSGTNPKIASAKESKSIIKENEDTNKKLNEKATQMAAEIDDLLKENDNKINTSDEPKIRNFETDRNKLDEDFDLMKLKIDQNENKED